MAVDNRKSEKTEAENMEMNSVTESTMALTRQVVQVERVRGSTAPFWMLIIASQILCVTAIVLVVSWTRDYRGGFTWSQNQTTIQQHFNYHPVFLVSGMIVLNAEAQLLYRIFHGYSHVIVKLVHFGVQSLALVLSGFGFLAVYQFAKVMEFKSFVSMHSWLGLATMGLFSVQFLFGFLAFIVSAFALPNSTIAAQFRKKLLPVHRVVGVATLILGAGTAPIGINEKAFFSFPGDFFELGPETELVNTLGVVIVGLAALVTFIMLNPNLRNN